MTQKYIDDKSLQYIQLKFLTSAYKQEYLDHIRNYVQAAQNAISDPSDPIYPFPTSILRGALAGIQKGTTGIWKNKQLPDAYQIINLERSNPYYIQERLSWMRGYLQDGNAPEATIIKELRKFDKKAPSKNYSSNDKVYDKAWRAWIEFRKTDTNSLSSGLSSSLSGLLAFVGSIERLLEWFFSNQSTGGLPPTKPVKPGSRPIPDITLDLDVSIARSAALEKFLLHGFSGGFSPLQPGSIKPGGNDSQSLSFYKTFEQKYNPGTIAKQYDLGYYNTLERF